MFNPRPVIPAGHDARSEFMSFLDILKLQSRLKIITISGVFHCFFFIQMTEAEPGKLKASEFHLSWNNYEASLASFLRVLSEAKEGEEALYDVTISCSGGKLFQVSD